MEVACTYKVKLVTNEVYGLAQQNLPVIALFTNRLLQSSIATLLLS